MRFPTSFDQLMADMEMRISSRQYPCTARTYAAI